MTGELGAIGRSTEGIEIWNRSWPTLKDRLFPEDITHIPLFSVKERLRHKKYWKTIQYWFTPAGTAYNPESHVSTLITVDKPVGNLHDIFIPGKTIMDVGCGGGAGAIGMAREFRKSNILATDYELGNKIPIPQNVLPNLTFQQEDWRNFSLPPHSIDGFVSDQGIAKYGGEKAAEELTRIARKGAFFRGTQDRGVWGKPNFHDLLAQFGWNVWYLRNPAGGPSNLVVAQYEQVE